MSEIVTLPYAPEAFNKPSMDDSKGIILTPDFDQSVNERWEKETPYLVDMIQANFDLNGMTIVDYGCGIGRVSREIFSRGIQCAIVGVDISPTMRGFSQFYMNDPRFLIASPVMFNSLLNLGMRADLVLSIWALQHMPDLEQEVKQIERVLPQGKSIFLVDEPCRFIPARQEGIDHPTGYQWIDDQKSVTNCLEESFDLVKRESLDPRFVTKPTSERVSWAIYTKR